MGPLERETARRRGRRNLEAMKQRAGRLRRRVAALAIVGFVLLWAAVFTQMATGGDPALGAGGAAREKAIPHPERRSLQATVPPPGEEDGDDPTIARAAAAEAEWLEAEQREAEARELEELESEELEALTTGQS